MSDSGRITELERRLAALEERVEGLTGAPEEEPHPLVAGYEAFRKEAAKREEEARRR